MRTRPLSCPVMLLFTAAGSLAAQAPAEVRAFTSVTVVDVAAGRLEPNRTVIVSGNRIVAVGGAAEARTPAGAVLVDGRGKYLMPGLWDVHVHAAYLGLDELFLPLLLANGITGVREMFSTAAFVDSARARVARGSIAGPRIVASGHILDGKPPIWPGSVGVANAAEARRAVDSLKASGADFIKVYSRLSPEAFHAAVDQATRLRLPVAGHVPSLVRVGEASDAGLKSIEHLTGMLTACSSRGDELLAQLTSAVGSAKGWDSAGALGRATTGTLLSSFDPGRCTAVAKRLAANGTWMVPTIQVLRSTAFLDDTTLALDPRLKYIPAGFRSQWNPRADSRFRMLTPEDWANRRAIYAQQLEIVALLHRAGVPFLAGTDLANPYILPGFSLHDELASLVAAGFSPADALRSATLLPARFLGAADSLGLVARGMVADLLLLDADPLADVRNATRISGVMANGRYYDRTALDGLLAAGEARAAGRPQ